MKVFPNNTNNNNNNNNDNDDDDNNAFSFANLVFPTPLAIVDVYKSRAAYNERSQSDIDFFL